MVSEFWQNNGGTKKAIIIYTAVVAITTIFEARLGYVAINDLSDYADRPERFSRLGPPRVLADGALLHVPLLDLRSEAGEWKSVLSDTRSQI
ncbi:hypothetical protein MTO96_009430 [Rhipicephalus appendiculatus]